MTRYNKDGVTFAIHQLPHYSIDPKLQVGKIQFFTHSII